MKTTRPASKPTVTGLRAAYAEAKAGEGHRSAPLILPALGGFQITRPESTSPAARHLHPGGSESKAVEEPQPTRAPETRPAPGESQTARTASTSPVAGRAAEAGSKAGEGLPELTALKTSPAPYGPQTARPESTSPAIGTSTADAGSKAGEDRK